MRPSYRPDISPKPQQYRTQILDHLGLVAGMFEEPGITEVIDRATQQDPEMRIVTAGHAVKAMVLNGLGFVNQQLYLVPHFFQNKPLSRLIAPGIQASHLNDDTLGRALDTLYAFGVTELYSLIAATAATRLGLTRTFSHLDTTSFHVDGRYNSDKAPDEHVVHITQGYSRDHRPDLNQVMLELVVEHQAGIPVLMQPLSGNSHDGKVFGQVVSDHIAQLHTTSNPTSLVADSALYSAENLHKLADTSLKWITRVPATLTEAQEVLAQAQPATMPLLQEGYRYAVWPRNMAVWRNAGSSSTRSIASRRPSVRSISSGSSRATRKPKPSRGCAAQRLPVKRMPSRHSHVLWQACRPRFSTTAPSAPRRTMGSGGAQALEHSPPSSSTISPGPWRLGPRSVGHASTTKAVLSSQRTNWTRASYPPRRCSTDTKGKPRRNVDFASSKTRNFWPLLSILKSPSASWPC